MNIREVKNLVFEGGSVKGIAYLGALEALQAEGLDLAQIQRIAGTSAGAITAALLGVGYSLPGIRQELYALDFKSFLDEAKNENTQTFFFAAVKKKETSGTSTRISTASTASVSHPIAGSQVSSRLSSNFGIYDGEALRLWVENCLYVKTGKRFLTFKELHDMAKAAPDLHLKDIFIPGVDLATGYTVTFDYLHTPNDIIADAVRISASIPFLFKPHLRYIKNAQGERVLFQPEHIFADGGVVNNYLINAFDFAGFVDDNIAEDSNAFWQGKNNPNTLGLRLSSKKNIDYFTGKNEANATEITNLMAYTKSLMQAIWNKQNSDHQRVGDKVRTIYIDNQGIDTLAFDLTEGQKQQLIAAGREGVNNFVGSYVNREQQIVNRPM